MEEREIELIDYINVVLKRKRFMKVFELGYGTLIFDSGCAYFLVVSSPVFDFQG